MRRSVSLLYPGPHVFLIVIQIGRFTQEEKEAVHQIKQAMGSHALGFSVVVFTHGDLLEEGKSVKHSLIDRCNDLDQLVGECGGRYCVFNNQSSKSKEQVSELFALVDSLMQGNGGSCYSSKMLLKAEEGLAQELQEEKRLLNKKEDHLQKKQRGAVKEVYKKELEMVQPNSGKEMKEKQYELGNKKNGILPRHREEALRREREENQKKQMEKKIQDMVRVMEICREGEERKEALQEKLETCTKMLEEQAEQNEKMSRAIEEKIQKDEEENENKERDREFQQKQTEQSIRQMEEMTIDALQRELRELTQSLEEQSRREEERKKQMESLFRREREESQRERDIQMENQRAEKRRTEAFKQELKLIQMKIEQLKTSEENLKRQLEENLRRERERCDREMSLLKKRCDKKCSELCNETIKKGSTERYSTLTNVTAYAQQMGVLVLNVALESLGAPCCIQ